jgi:hypothetical protein
MCEQLVRFVDEICMEKGIKVCPSDYKLPRVNKQARGRATPQLIPEYEKVLSILVHDMPANGETLQAPSGETFMSAKTLGGAACARCAST